jgi:uncharacterized phage protein (TIGR01671 family)
MREIKFRAWDRDREVMIGADYSLNWGSEEEEYWGDEHKIDLTGIEEINRDERFVVMQYTGLRDKNGKEIYEGDIVHVSEKSWDGEDIEVKWTEGVGFECAEDCPLANIDVYENYVVVGNIYENPELLK